MLLVDLLDRLEIGRMHMQLDIPTGTTSLGRSSGTTSVLITSPQG
jgi:galactokinase/mevalonate kinase-like predicted kinase